MRKIQGDSAKLSLCEGYFVRRLEQYALFFIGIDLGMRLQELYAVSGWLDLGQRWQRLSGHT